MRIGIIQSSYIPWRGYFDFIKSVDLFIFHDDLQYTKGHWRQRNKIKTNAGLQWITVPVKYNVVSQLICDTQIDRSNKNKWEKDHLNKFKNYYQKATYFIDAFRILEEGLSYNDETISQLNIRLTKLICEYLCITTPLVFSSDYHISGAKTERLIELLKKTNSTEYLSGPSAKDYLEEELFKQNNISLEYKTYNYSSYPQLWGGFIGEVTVLDLIANMGEEAKNNISSLTPNILVS